MRSAGGKADRPFQRPLTATPANSTPETSPLQQIQLQHEQPGLPDLLEAFWGDAAARAAEGQAKRPAAIRRRNQPRNTAAARSTQRSKTTSEV